MAIKQEFKINRQGKEFVLFAGLLDAAHSKLESIEVEEIEVVYDNDKPLRARHKANITYDGKTFVGHGDADVNNVSRNIAPHLIRMSETRAKARALRDAINVGTAALEELSGEDEERDTQPQRSSQRPSGGSGGRSQSQPTEEPPVEDEGEQGQGEELATPKQVEGIENLLERLKDEGETRDQAIEKMEEYLGYPLDLMGTTQAENLKKSLQKKANEKAKKEKAKK